MSFNSMYAYLFVHRPTFPVRGRWKLKRVLTLRSLGSLPWVDVDALVVLLDLVVKDAVGQQDSRAQIS